MENEKVEIKEKYSVFYFEVLKNLFYSCFDTVKPKSPSMLKSKYFDHYF